MRASDGKVLSDAELVAKDPVLKTFKLIGNRFNACWQRIPEVLELSDNIPPFLWYADFCTFENENKDTKFSLLRVGADCPAICQCLPARCSAENPTACVDHIPIEIRADVEDMGETIGKMIQEALEPGTLAQLIKMAGCAECLPSCFG